MAILEDRPRFLTENEKYGCGVVPPDEGGAWVVEYAPEDGPRHICCIFDNRAATEAYLNAKAADGRDLDDYTVSVWTIRVTFPDADDDE